MDKKTEEIFKKIDEKLNKIREGKMDKVVVRHEGPGHITVEIVPIEDQ